MNQIGENIKKIREHRSITQDQLSEMVGIHRVTLAKYEAGKSIPGADVLGRLAKALHVKADVLLGNDDELTDEDRELFERREQLRRDPGRRILFDLARNGTKRDIDSAVALIDALKKTNPDFYDGDDPS